MTAHLDQLVHDLRAIFASDPTGAAAAERLRSYVATYDDWREFVLLDQSTYTRNLIDKSERFELLLLGWSAGQASPVHNHEGQNCWMGVLEGGVEELGYSFPCPDRGTLEGPLEQTCDKRFLRGEVAFIRDEIGLHLVRPANAEPAVSLHLYAKPFGECNCYCDQTGRITRKQLSYYSVRGQRVGS